MIRPPLRPLLGFTLLAGLALSATTQAAGNPVTADFEARLQQARAAGILSPDQYFIERFSYVFAPDEVDPRFLMEAPEPTKGTTWLIAEYQQAKRQLRPETVAYIEDLLSPSATTATYDTPHFRFTYSLTGQDAVPSTDSDGNGVPDFVQNMGVYAEYCWSAEVDQMGFAAPYLSPNNSNRMPVSFKQQNSYAYTRCPGGTCSIVCENDFAGFPPDDDPEGTVAGASKVTFAHEFKHASQYAASQWSENGWVELDATWMEDQAYVYVNDYVQYINSNQSQIVVPTDSLDKGGSGSYYDAIWQYSMSDRFGLQIITDFWTYRSTHTAENVEVSYDTILKKYGSSLSEHFSYDYFLRNYLTNTRAVGKPLYNDALAFQLGPTTTLAIGASSSGSLSPLAGQFIEVSSNGSSTAPVVSFSAGSKTVFGLVVVQWKKDGTMSTVPVKITNGAATVTLGVAWSGLNKLGLVVSNGNFGRMATSASYTLAVK